MRVGRGGRGQPHVLLAEWEEVRALHHVGADVVRLPDNVSVDFPKGDVGCEQATPVGKVRQGVVVGLEEAELGALEGAGAGGGGENRAHH